MVNIPPIKIMWWLEDGLWHCFTHIFWFWGKGISCCAHWGTALASTMFGPESLVPGRGHWGNLFFGMVTTKENSKQYSSLFQWKYLWVSLSILMRLQGPSSSVPKRTWTSGISCVFFSPPVPGVWWKWQPSVRCLRPRVRGSGWTRPPYWAQVWQMSRTPTKTPKRCPLKGRVYSLYFICFR